MTHVRITTVPLAPGAGDRLAELWTSLLPHYRATEGFEGLSSLHDPATDTAVTLTWWSSAEAADAAAEELRPLALKAADGLLLGAPTIVGYDEVLPR